MKFVDASHEILTPISYDGMRELEIIEQIARTCYKSEPKHPGPETTKKFIKNLITRKHEAMLEHGYLTIKFICDRGVSHELVRHRMASFAQESTRYCNYSDERFGSELTFVTPFFMKDTEKEQMREGWLTWLPMMSAAEFAYDELIKQGYSPQEARSVLPNSLKTEIVVTANYREWRHILKLRTAPDAHPQMRELMLPLLEELQHRIPVLFDDIKV